MKKTEMQKALSRRAGVLKAQGYKDVKIHNKSVSGRLPLKKGALQNFRIRRLEVRVNYEWIGGSDVPR